jgi:hypothetical protein
VKAITGRNQFVRATSSILVNPINMLLNCRPFNWPFNWTKLNYLSGIMMRDKMMRERKNRSLSIAVSDLITESYPLRNFNNKYRYEH